MRKSIDGLSLIIVDSLAKDPGDGTVYVFFNKAYDKIKLIYWDRNGFCLLYKRLEKQKFIIPKIIENVLHVEPEQFRWLLDGLDISKLEGFRKLRYTQFC
jgi:transposase